MESENQRPVNGIERDKGEEPASEVAVVHLPYSMSEEG